MSTYRNYGPWSSSKTSSYSSGIDKPSSTTLDRSSRFGSSSSSGYRPTSGLTSSSYRPVPTVTSVRERAAAVETTTPSDKPSIREKYAARTYGDSSGRDSVSDTSKTSSAGNYRRYGSAYSPTETPPLRFGSSTRFGAQIARSPISEKSPTVFGVSTSIERIIRDEEKKVDDVETSTVVLVTRGTSPTPPPNSAYLRTRRADMERTTQKTVPRPNIKPPTTTKEVQTDDKPPVTTNKERVTSTNSGITTSRSPTSYTSRYSGSSYTPSSSSRYTPRASSYSYTRPTDLPLRSSSITKNSSHDDTKTTPIESLTKSTEELRRTKLEGRDTERIGGFSYARPTDLPLVTSLNKTPTDNEDKTITAPSSPIRNKTTSPIIPDKKNSIMSSKESLVNSSNEQLSDKNRKNSSEFTIEVTTPESVSSKPTPNTTKGAKVPLSPSKSTTKLTSPDRSKLPPPVPKVDLSKTVIPNKDFRKSVLNMDLSSSSESVDKKRNNEGLKPLAGSKSLSKLKLSASSPKLSPKSLQSISKSNESSESSSEESSESESSESESSESDSSDDNDSSKSKSLTTTGSKILSNKSRTSGNLSSPDEASISVDKPPRPPTSPKLKTADNRTLEAKKVVARALAPITGGIMKVKYTGSSTDELSDKSTKSNKDSDKSGDSSTGKMKKSSSNASLGQKGIKIQKNESGERAWWMKSNDNIPKISDQKDSEEEKGFKIKRIQSGEKAWWMKSSDNIPGVQKSKGGQSNSPSESESVGSISAHKSDDDKMIRGKLSKSSSKENNTMSLANIKRIQSGERAWWLGSSSDEPGAEKSDKSSDKEKNVTFSGDVSDEQSGDKSPKDNMWKIKKIESGERAWWLSSSSDDQGRDKPPSNKSSDREKSVSFQEGNKTIPGALKKSLSSKSISKSSSKSSLRQTKSGENTSSGIEPVASDEKETGFLQRIRRIESGEKAWWMDSDSDKGGKVQSPKGQFELRRFDSGEKDWWLDKSEDVTEERPKTPVKSPKRPKDLPLFIGRHTNIDDLLGTEAPPPAAFRTPNNSSSDEDSHSEDCLEVGADQVRIHDSVARTPTTIIRRRGMIKLDDTALQLYKDGDYGSYLDLDASINEQQEEFEDFQTNRKNSIVLRTQLSVRVHTIIEKLLNSEGRELRRALFSLKQIFQEDKDLVHEFVQNDGLACLIKVGSDADQNYQNYILRALGQVMLYVDGMNGVIEHSPTVQWLYSLVSSKFRLVVKTALKLLLVFVEYVETNSVLLVKAIHAVDSSQGTTPWSNLMKLLKEYDAADTELLIYATSLINKTLNGLPDQDTYYDQVDALEEQGFESIIRRYMSKQGTDLDLLRQFQIYEAVLHHEDGEEKGTPLKQLDETIRKTLKHRKCLTATLNQSERRKSRRHSTGTSPHALTLNLNRQNSHNQDLNLPPDDYHNEADDAGVTPALRRRRERAERQRSFIREQRELRASLSSTDQSGSEDGGITRNGIHGRLQNGGDTTLCNGESSPLRRENTVKDLTQKLATTLGSPVEDGGKLNSPFSDMKGIISKAKEGLAKSQSRGDMLKSPTTEIPPPIRPPEIKKTETELQWEELVKNSSRALSLCDLDFTDLSSGDERDVLAPAFIMNGGPPPPPPCGIPPPVPVMAPIAPTAPPPLNNTRVSSPVRKNKKTVKLFWKEVRDDPLAIVKMKSHSLIWDELSPVSVDTQKLEHLFESRAKDLITKKQQEMNKNKEIIVLDHKRSNAINIGMTKLPPPRSIKTAILKMDATVMNREGIEKLLTMLPTEEERSKIQEAQAANPDLPLGSAEQFLLTLASISELPARLKLWAFKLDFEISEKEIAEPLMDLKQGMEVLKTNKTFRGILGTLLSIGIFLNGNEVKGFQIEYLAKVPEVKDTVHKHSLLHHLCHMVMEKFPDSTDLYSEIGAVTRASKVDFDELTGNLHRIETECKASFDHLKVIVKHDGSMTNLKVKMSDFLADCAERIIVLSKVHRRVINRYHKFCLWLGIPFHRVQANKPNELCRIVSEFALEYRTTRERVLQQFEKKANHRERNKTRGKMITEVGKFRSQEDRADAELRQLLGNEAPDNDASFTGSLPWRRQRTGRTVLGPLTRGDGTNGNLTDADDEIIESLVKTATKSPSTRTAPRERKRTRHADRKSLRRTLRNGLSEEEKKHLAAYIKGY